MIFDGPFWQFDIYDLYKGFRYYMITKVSKQQLVGIFFASASEGLESSRSPHHMKTLYVEGASPRGLSERWTVRNHAIKPFQT